MFFLICILVVFSTANAGNDTKLNPVVQNCDFNQLYTENVNSAIEFIFLFANASKITTRSPARITVQSAGADKSYPVLFVVRQQKGVLSWQLPYVVETPHRIEQYHLVSRTLCPVSNYYKSAKHGLAFLPGASQGQLEVQNSLAASREDVIVSVSSASTQNVTFSVYASIEEDFYISMDEKRMAYMTPSEPRYFAFEFPLGISTVLLEVDSQDSACMTISIQNISCPIFDLEGSIEFEGMWQTMTKKGGITLTRDRFPLGFFVVFVVRGDDAPCLGENTQPESNNSRAKNVTFSLRKKISYDEYLVATFGAFGIFLVFYAVAFVVVIVHHMNKRNQNAPLPIINTDDHGEEPIISPQDAGNLELLWEKFNAGQEVYVSDISRLGCHNLRQGSQMYLWNLLTVAIFYSLPVVQLVITYQRVLNNTGNQDLCFYNFLCSHPVGVLSDFNHVFSNIGYGMLGLLFVFLVNRRERHHLAAVAENPALDQHYGIPQQFGLFYAMGAALICEGVLSACYHVCPNYSNFQFDTSFMYVIAMMCMLRIYQNRHPDIHASAYTTFGVLAIVIFIGMTGVLTGTILFWAIFTAIHMVVCLVLSAQVYFMGCWSLDLHTIVRVFNAYRPSNNESICRCILPVHPRRMVLLIIANIVNIAFAVLGIKYHPRNFASYLLAIFMANLNIYCWFYIIMKLISKEKIRLIPLFHIIMSFLFWGLSLYFFFHKAISWEQTPALSRTYNHPCNMLDFYDNHDIWHFLSAGAMFFSFMVLLSLDDDLRNVPRNQIRIF